MAGDYTIPNVYTVPNENINIAPIVGALDFRHLAELVVWMDSWLDSAVSPEYQSQPLAQDWARVAKTSEEAGEAIDALIGITGQNPRKGTYGEKEHLLEELADVALTGLYAIQHFTKNGDQTMRVLLDRAQAHYDRVQSKDAEDGKEE